MYYRIIFILVSTIIISSCQGKMELERTFFPIVMGIDYDKSDNKIIVYLQTNKLDEGSGTIFKVIEGRGETLKEAMRNLSDHWAQNFTINHVAVVIITKKLAEHGIKSELDYLLRVKELRISSYFYITDIDLKELLESKLKNDVAFSSPLMGIHEIVNNNADVVPILLREFAVLYFSEGKSPIIPRVDVIKDKDNKILIDYVGLAAFKKDFFSGWLDEHGTLGFIWVNNEASKSTFVISLPYDGKNGKVTVSSVESQRKFLVNIENNSPIIRIKFNVRYNIGQMDISDRLDTNTISKLDKEVESYVKDTVKNVINKAQKELKTDILGFGQEIYRKYPKYWYENKGNWDELFENLDVRLEAKAKFVDGELTSDSVRYFDEKE